MGCANSKPDTRPEERKKAPLTFGRDPNLIPADFIFSHRTDETLYRDPGSIRGQQFIIEECKNCHIYLFDHTASVQIDQCENCHIIIGPCESSVFIRDCKDCVLVCATQQFRTRDCRNLDIFLYCSTEPIIETSSSLRIGCYTLSYFSLSEQFEKAKLCIWNNKWSAIYDFTKDSSKQQQNWTRLPYGTTHHSYFSSIDQEWASNVSYDSSWIVPYTAGAISQSDSSFLCFYKDGKQQAAAFVEQLLSSSENQVKIVKTRSCLLTQSQALTLLQDASNLYKDSTSVVGFELQGHLPSEVLPEDGFYLVSDRDNARVKIDCFFEQWKEKV